MIKKYFSRWHSPTGGVTDFIYKSTKLKVMSTLTYQQIEYLQYCVKETAFNDGDSRSPKVQAIKNKLIAMRAELERAKRNTTIIEDGKGNEDVFPDDDPSVQYYIGW